jgi:hypothetical protein
MKKVLYFSVLMIGICVMLISSSFKPVDVAVDGVEITCTGPQCVDANGLFYNTLDPWFKQKVCCGIADEDRGCQQTVD